MRFTVASNGISIWPKRVCGIRRGEAMMTGPFQAWRSRRWKALILPPRTNGPAWDRYRSTRLLIGRAHHPAPDQESGAPIPRRWRLLVLGIFAALPLCALAANPLKQKSLDEWRSLTAPDAPAPRVFVKGDNVRFYFQSETNIVEFSAHWTRLRVPTAGYKVSSALLRWEHRLAAIPERKPGWSEATVIAGAEWRRLTTNLVAAMTPKTPGHGAYYQGFLSDRVWYRDANGVPCFGSISEQLPGVTIERRFSIDETMQTLAQVVEADLRRGHPDDSLFLLMAPNALRFPQPLLLDLKHPECVWLSPAALYDPLERGLSL